MANKLLYVLCTEQLCCAQALLLLPESLCQGGTKLLYVLFTSLQPPPPHTHQAPTGWASTRSEIVQSAPEK